VGAGTASRCDERVQQIGPVELWSRQDGRVHETVLDSPAPVQTRSRTTIAVTGLAGALLGWLLAAPMEASFAGSKLIELPYVPDAWAPAYTWMYELAGEPLGLSPYYFWGKAAFLMYVAGVLVVRTLPPGRGRRGRVGRRILLGAFVVGLAGNLMGYWGGAGDEITLLSTVGFLGLEAPAMLAMLVSMAVLGFGYRRDGMPRRVSWLFVGSVVAVPLFNGLVIGYAPHGVLVPILLILTAATTAVHKPR
jgi:hypothetical protein